MAKVLLDECYRILHDERGHTAISRNFLYYACRAKELPHFRIGKRYVLDVDEIEEFLNKKSNEGLETKDFKYGTLRRVDVKWLQAALITHPPSKNINIRLFGTLRFLQGNPQKKALQLSYLRK